MTLLLLFAFLAGIVTVLSPCILPLLPIILSSADGSGRKKPLGVVIGFVGSFTFFTLFLSSIVRLSGISADALRMVSVIILGVFGVSLLIPKIQAYIEIFFSRFAKHIPTSNGTTGFFGGILIGMSLGLLWTPCVGPILASVISLAITGTVTAQTFLITLSYAMGTAIPMFIIMLAGSTALQRAPWLVRNTAKIQKMFGVLMILTAIGVYFGVERQFQSWVLQTFPNYGTGLTQFENVDRVTDQLKTIGDNQSNESSRDVSLADLSNAEPVPAPELVQGGEWFNSPPLQLEDLRGKVVLIDFWTYSCINCQRTLPYLTRWWDTYKDQSLVIIGIHSPEFEFEKNPDNVQQAIDDFSIKYPVMQDNAFATWRAYANRYWPAKYLIDKNGLVRYTHFGEGKYDETEAMIQTLLREGSSDFQSTPISNPEYRLFAQTPELYLGYARIEHLVSPESINRDTDQSFSAPANLQKNSFAFEGIWKLTSEFAAPSKSSKLHLNFSAKNVFLVARPRDNQQGVMRVTLDGQDQSVAEDSLENRIVVDSDRLYPILSLPTAGEHTLTIEFLDDNLEVYAFTFG